MAINRFRAVRAGFHIVAALSLLSSQAAVGYDWLQFGGNAQHSGNNALETSIASGNVATLGPKYQITLPAGVDGSPVFLEGVGTASGIKDLLFVTTTAGHIIALDAASGAQVWAHQYPAGTCRINNGSSACYTTSSPAIDPNRQYVYSYGLDGYAHKYQAGDGVEITSGGWPQLTTYKGFDEKGSSALSIATSNGTSYLYVAHAGYPGDQGDYQGHMTAINLATGAQKVFNTACSDQSVHFRSTSVAGATPTCTTRQNAIWSRPGVVYDAGTDRIFMGTGNAFTTNAGRFDGNHNWSESVIALLPDASGGTGASLGKPVDSYTPPEHDALDNADADVGSTAPAILPVPATSNVQHLAVQSGKDAKIRLLNLANLSGQGGPGHTGGEVAAIINVPQGGGVLSQPAVWVNPADNTTWVFIVNGNGASALRLAIDGSGNPSLVLRWTIGQGGTSPSVANGIVFYIDGGTVRAVNAVSGAQVWSVANPGGTHWHSLIVANGAVYATDGSSHLSAFTLPATPVATTTALASSVNPSTVGSSVVFTATVTGAAPTGTVDFQDGGASIGACASVALTGSGNTRNATCATSALAAGAHTIVAAYGGDNGNAASASTPLSQVISTNASTFGNGGFETPNLGGNYQYTPSGATWTFNGGAGITGNANAFTSGNPVAPEGVQVAFLQGAGSATQIANIGAGQYTLSLQAAQRAISQSGTQIVRVQVDGVTVGQYQPPSASYTTYATAAFTISTSGNHVIVLAGIGSGGDYTAFVDNVRLSAATVGSAFANGGFETPGLNGNYAYGPAGATWTFSGGGGITGNNNGFTSGNAGAPEGVQVAFLQGTGGASQTATFAAGQYALTFQAAQRGNLQDGVQIVRVQVDGVTVGQYQPPGSSYGQYQTPAFTLAAGSHTISLSGAGSGGDYTAFVDNVAIGVAGTPGVIANGGFEAPSVAGSFQYAPEGAAWVFANGGGITGNASGFTAGNPSAPEGGQVAFLQVTGTATQTVTMTSGQYTLSLQAAQRGNFQSGTQIVRVAVDGVSVGQYQPAGTSYTVYQTPQFTVASSGSHTITLSGVGSGNDFTAFVDNVSAMRVGP